MLFITFLNSLKEETVIEVLDDKVGEIYEGSVKELWEYLARADLLCLCVSEITLHREHMRVSLV